MPKIKTRTSYRRADNGRYTTEDYAKKNPKTTVKETDRVKSTSSSFALLTI